MSTNELASTQRRCWEFINASTFKNNISYKSDETIQSAYQKGLAGQDAGITGLTTLMPQSTNLKEWFDFLFLTYFFYLRR